MWYRGPSCRRNRALRSRVFWGSVRDPPKRPLFGSSFHETLGAALAAATAAADFAVVAFFVFRGGGPAVSAAVGAAFAFKTPCCGSLSSTSFSAAWPLSLL